MKSRFSCSVRALLSFLTVIHSNAVIASFLRLQGDSAASNGPLSDLHTAASVTSTELAALVNET